MESPLVTFIVPAYNVEKTLRQTLDSLLNQTVMNHRVIVVNDGSKDSTEEIAKTYVESNPGTVRLISKTNHGLGAARNTGMKYVDTLYTAFIDSDDWEDTRLVEKFTNLVSRCDSLPEVILLMPWIVDRSTNQVLPWYSKYTFDSIFSLDGNKLSLPVINTMMCPQLLGAEVSANSKIYLTRFLQKINFQFPEGVCWEDVRPHFQLLHEANDVAGLSDAGFFYRINEGSPITHGTGKTRLDSILVFQDLLNYVNSHNFSDQEYAYVLRLLVSYTKWNLDVVNSTYKMDLLRGYHDIYKKIPMSKFNLYLNTCSPHRRKEYVMIQILKSNHYGLIFDYLPKEKTVRWLERNLKK